MSSAELWMKTDMFLIRQWKKRIEKLCGVQMSSRNITKRFMSDLVIAKQ